MAACFHFFALTTSVPGRPHNIGVLVWNILNTNRRASRQGRACKVRARRSLRTPPGYRILRREKLIVRQRRRREIDQIYCVISDGSRPHVANGKGTCAGKDCFPGNFLKRSGPCCDLKHSRQGFSGRREQSRLPDLSQMIIRFLA
jgi:hypothetical protein